MSTNNLMELLKTKEQADKLMEKINVETSVIATKFAIERTNKLLKVQNDLRKLLDFMRTLNLDELKYGIKHMDYTKNFFNTNLNTSSNSNDVIYICLALGKDESNDIAFLHYKNAYKQMCYYYGEPCIFNVCSFPSNEKYPLNTYSKDLLHLMENWETVYPIIEKGVIDYCDELVKIQLKECNQKNERVKKGL